MSTTLVPLLSLHNVYMQICEILTLYFVNQRTKEL